MENEKIAVIGLGIIAPKALNKEEFWSNVKNKRNCIIDVPKDRWDPALYYDPDPKAKDKTYSKIGGFIENFKFDSIKYKIPPSSAAQISRLQQMTIEAVRMALEDAGYDHSKNDPKRTGVIIANAMGAMRKELTDMRVYKFLNEDLMLKTSVLSSLPSSEKEKIISEYEELLDKHIINITEDTMPGELANVTSGRIANIFNFNGPNLTLDAACASSFAALDYAVMALRSGKIDVAISGGADEMMSPAAYVKFCKIGALSPDGSWAFDAKANGFVMAEAVGVYVLKRVSDALRDGDRIYALINSVGASSDGKGKGITAPNPKGQKIAIENAFSGLDYGPGDVDFVECHGTATKVGDAAEAQVLKEFFGPHLSGRRLKITSVKSQIGHSKAAAGAVSLIKTALALHEKVLPPSANFSVPNPNIDFNVVEVITEAQDYVKNSIRRANVSSFGFGGTNFHVTMEEYCEKEKQKYLKLKSDSSYSGHQSQTNISENKEVTMKNNLSENPKTPYSALQGETFTITASNLNDLKYELDSLSQKISGLGEKYPLSYLSFPLNASKQKEYGISIVAKSPSDLADKISMIYKSYGEKIFEENPLSFKLKGIYAFKNRINYSGKIGFLFPGQGSQYVDMMRDLAAKYEVVQDTFDEADRILQKMIDVKLTDVLWSKEGESKEELAKREAAIKQTQMTQPAVMTADMAMFRLLKEFGIKPDMAIGHSLGEYAAATAAGIFTLENGLRAVTSRAKEMSNIKVADPGKMASIAWPVEKVEEQLKKINGYVIAANKNCPIQTVIAGECKAVEEAVKIFQGLGIQAQEIPVSHAFHSAIIQPAIGPYRDFLRKIPIKSWDMPILSNVTADFFPKDTDGIYEMLVKQMVSPVEFINQIKRMYDEGVRVFIECGPKRVLSAFVTTTLEDKKDIFVLSSNHPKRGGIFEFNDMLANLMTVDFKLNWQGKKPSADNSVYNPYYLNWALSFEKSQNEEKKQEATDPQPEISSFAQNYGFNFNPIAFSGIAGGAPGTWDKLFRERSLDEILDGKNMIEPIPQEWREKQIDKNIIRVIKSETGNHRIEPIDSVEESIKLSARKGSFDIESEFGIPQNVAKAMNDTFRMAIGAGILALKDAGIPLIRYYKKTTTGGWLPEKWALPEPIASETGVVFASAFPTMESIIKEVTDYFTDKYSGLSDDKLWDIYDSIVEKLHSQEDKNEIRKWMKANIGKFQSSDKKEKYSFSQNFLLKVIPIADSQFAQWVGAKGPAVHISAACASTTQAVNIAESWIRAGKCKRVVVISADDITNEAQQQWTMPGFLSSGTATTKDKVEEAALPFDNRRNGLIVGSACVGMVLEDETLIKERGMKPLARLLLTEVANSAYHITRLDTEHVSQVMDNFITKIERIYGLKRSEIAPYTLFMSHETYTPKRGGSASAEVKALRKAFGADADKIIVSNVKGFTGHTMGASLEDAIAVRAMNTGIVPPIANYKEPDPELGGINLSKGGKYDFKYAIRFAAGFGSHMALSFSEKVYSVQEKRTDETVYKNWLKTLCGYENPITEVEKNTLRIKDMGPIKVEQKQKNAFVQKTQQMPAKQETAPAPKHEHYSDPVEQIKPVQKTQALNEDAVKEQILNMICEKTGYPKDMLELDLDMEADLGIDTVKQAELFAAIREYFEIPKQENLSLKDYPTIRHCVKFVLDNKSVSQTPAKQETAPAPKHEHYSDPVEQIKPVQKTQTLNEDAVKEQILNMICEKTGYPKDMLELDLDMEADLGIDTVKQAELFAAIREYFEIPKQENLSLKDYPTIRHCVKFVLDNKSVSQTTTKHSQKETINKYLESGSSHSKEIHAPASATAVAEPEINIDEIKKAVENNHPPRHFRYTPVICEMPVKEEIIKKFDPARPVLIIGENLELIKSCRKELTKLELSSVVLTSQKTKLSETWTVDFAQEESAENALKEIALKYPDIQGIIYLMGCADKPFVNSLDPMKDMRYYALPLFSAIKLFNKALNNPSQGCSCFVASATTCDGRFGYSQNASYDPVYASIYGISLCMRKELDKAVVKLIDFEKDAPISLITRKIFYEVQYSDLRHTICYHSNKRHSMIAIPAGINKTKEKYPLKGKKVIITGGGRGLGALFAKIIASRWQPEIIIMDIIEENPFAEKLLSMTAQEAENYKKTEFLASLKEKNSKVTPAILEKEFTKLKDAAGLIKTLKELSALGSKVSYLRCDLNNAAQFEETVLKLKEKSRADGLVHFAGLERSKLIADKEKEEFELIFKTKAQSAINLWKADIVKDSGFWVMISSIAGKFGNLGQSDYAAASDYISKFAINLYNKGQKAFSIDMTGIANIGMGARPGVEAFLKSQNMEFLYPEEVMNALADEIVYGDLPELIYSGDLGKLDWDKQLQYEPSYGETKEKENTGLHFAYKGKTSKDSFSFEKNISVQSDPYMEDHAINGTPVFPGVMGIESFAQAINAYLSVKPLNLKNISFQLPIKLLKNNPADIRIKGEGKDNIQMRIESDFINSKGVKMGETRIHFKAEYDSSVSPTQSAPEHIKIKNKYKTEKETIYKTYFHGPSFQVLDGIISASDKEVLGVFKKPNTPLLKDKEMNYIFHPMIIEAVFQTCGWRDLYLENKMTLPDKIAQVSILDNNPDPEKLYTLAVYKGTDDYGKSIYDGWAFDENGKVFVFLKDYVMIPVKI